ncbi:MAG: diaminopimelate decarboxylase, partial [Verrucomicrobiota bacterium]|nr:diaminopimelate decarboxylase [Verrucomicrobiota bacterium]
GDFFCQAREIPDIKANDIIALMSAGAYSFTMASNYNSRPLPAEILIDGRQVHLARRRQCWDDLVISE